MMSKQISWTKQLGDAVLAQQADVMDAVQRLRGKAQANKKLTSNKQQTVSTEEQGGKEVIVIQPAEPNTVYVPYYDPGVVYGSWPYPSYPPYYFGAPGYIAGGFLPPGSHSAPALRLAAGLRRRLLLGRRNGLGQQQHQHQSQWQRQRRQQGRRRELEPQLGAPWRCPLQQQQRRAKIRRQPRWCAKPRRIFAAKAAAKGAISAATGAISATGRRANLGRQSGAGGDRGGTGRSGGGR